MKFAELSESKKINGFDYLRAISCIFVVAFHISPISMQSLFARTLHVFLFASAVPIFIILSLFLTELKNFDFNYVKKKSRSLLKIYFLWGWVIPFAVYWFCIFIGFLPRESREIQISLNPYEWIFNGLNWPLKVHGIYFLPFLIITTWIYLLIDPYLNSGKKRKVLLIALTMINMILPFLPENFKVIRESVVPFLIYIPLTKILYLDYKSGVNFFKKGILFFGGYLIVAALEGFLLISHKLEFVSLYHYSPYGRLSIVLLAVALVYWSFLVKNNIDNFSDTLRLILYCSLGIYLIHGFILDAFLISKLSVPNLLSFLLVVSFSILLSLLIKDIPRLNKILIL